MRIPLPTKRWKRVLLYIGSTFLILVAISSVLAAYWRRIEIGYDTTRLTAPVRPDGSIDYLAALNEELSKGVTPENNAAIPLLRAYGPGDNERIDPAFVLVCKALNVGVPPAEEGTIELSYFLSRNKKDRPGDDLTDDADVEKLEDRIKQPWRAEELPDVAAWVRRHDAALVHLHDAADRPRYFMPLVQGNVEPRMVIMTLLPALHRSRSLANVACARAMMRLGEGDAAGALADLMAVRKVARHIAQGSTLVELLVGMSMDDLASENERVAATSGQVSAEQLRRYAAELAALPPLPSAMKVVDRGERFILLDTLQVASRHGFIRTSTMAGAMRGQEIGRMSWLDMVTPVNYNAALRRANSLLDRFVAVGKEPTYARRNAAITSIEDDLRALQAKGAMLIVAPGDMMIAVLFPGLLKIEQRCQAQEMSRDLTILALRLEAWKHDQGAYPDRLGELAPQQSLGRIPQDRFLDGPLHYHADDDGYLLYSVGANMRDDQGRGRDDAKPGEPAPDDLAVRVQKGKYVHH